VLSELLQQQAIMQQEVEMQTKGIKAQMKGQTEVMMTLLKGLKKKEQKEKKKRRKRKAKNKKAADEAEGDKVHLDSSSSSSSSHSNSNY
jgi:hypothetical protein